MRSIIHGILNIFNFKGRMKRGEFWAFALFAFFLIYIVTTILFYPHYQRACDVSAEVITASDACLNTAQLTKIIGYDAALSGFSLVLLLLSAIVRRLHDVGKSGKIVVAYLLFDLGFLVLSGLNLTTITSSTKLYSLLTFLLQPYAILSKVVGLYLLYLLCQKGQSVNNPYGDVDILMHIRTVREELTGIKSGPETETAYR